jgi:hypothetical protein
VDALDYAIRLEQSPPRIPRATDDGAIISRTSEHVAAERQASEQTGDERVFA